MVSVLYCLQNHSKNLGLICSSTCCVHSIILGSQTCFERLKGIPCVNICKSLKIKYFCKSPLESLAWPERVQFYIALFALDLRKKYPWPFTGVFFKLRDRTKNFKWQTRICSFYIDVTTFFRYHTTAMRLCGMIYSDLNMFPSVDHRHYLINKSGLFIRPLHGPIEERRLNIHTFLSTLQHQWIE